MGKCLSELTHACNPTIHHVVQAASAAYNFFLLNLGLIGPGKHFWQFLESDAEEVPKFFKVSLNAL